MAALRALHRFGRLSRADLARPRAQPLVLRPYRDRADRRGAGARGGGTAARGRRVRGGFAPDGRHPPGTAAGRGVLCRRRDRRRACQLRGDRPLGPDRRRAAGGLRRARRRSRSRLRNGGARGRRGGCRPTSGPGAKASASPFPARWNGAGACGSRPCSAGATCIRPRSCARICRPACPWRAENDANAFAIGDAYGARRRAAGVTLALVLESGVGGAASWWTARCFAAAMVSPARSATSSCPSPTARFAGWRSASASRASWRPIAPPRRKGRRRWTDS